jgi:ketosteroid isomerase-like protein
VLRSVTGGEAVRKTQAETLRSGHDPAAPAAPAAPERFAPVVDFDRRHEHIRRVTRPSEVAESFVAAISRHDPDAVAACFAEDYEDEAPARRGEVVRGRAEVRANFGRMFRSMGDVTAEIVRLVERENEVWMEWRLSGTRDDGTIMDFVGVNIFGVADGTFAWGRIYTELARSAGGIEAQFARMTGGEPPA